ncbi:MAG: restriction endonuclease subunit S [Candidatus Paceibacterota bacterium]|jgi:type I restriction enzyme S subunit
MKKNQSQKNIPKDWKISTLSDISDIIMGQSPESSSYNQNGEGVPFFQGKADFTDSFKMKIHYWTSKPIKLSEPGDILLSVRAPVGDVALSDTNSCIGRGLASIRAKKNVSDQQFLFQVLQSLHETLNTKAQGSTFTAINGPALRKIPILLPTSTEQKKIAEILSKVDEEINKINELISKTEKIKNGLMNELFTKGIDHKKFKKTKLGEIPEEWEIKTLADIGENVIGLTYSPSEVVSEGMLVLRSSNIFENKIIYKDNVFVNKKVPQHLITKIGDILLCTRNGSRNLIGKNAYIDKNSAGYSFGAFMSVYRTEYNKFVFQFFQSKFFKEQVNKYLGATINQITTKSLNSFILPIPSIREQSKIVEVLLSVDKKLEKQKELKEKLIQLKKGLMSDLLRGKVRVQIK